MTTVYDWRWWPTAREIADDLRRHLAEGDTDMALRVLMDGINYLPDAAEQGQLAEALDEPETTGDIRWDTLLAAAIRYRLHTMGVTPPAWTTKPPLERFWMPVPINDAHMHRSMANAPAELLSVRIFMDERGFTTA